MRNTEEVMKILKKIRIERKINIMQVIDYLRIETGVTYSNKTIYGWENGYSSPNVICFIAMCDFYKIPNIYNLFEHKGLEEPEMVLELVRLEKLCRAYMLKPEMQESVHILLGID